MPQLLAKSPVAGNLRLLLGHGVVFCLDPARRRGKVVPLGTNPLFKTGRVDAILSQHVEGLLVRAPKDLNIAAYARRRGLLHLTRWNFGPWHLGLVALLIIVLTVWDERRAGPLPAWKRS